MSKINEQPSKKINVVTYFSNGNVTLNDRAKTVKHFCGVHGYTYDMTVEGKKKLQKDVPTSCGYYTGNNQRVNTVVTVDQILSMCVPNRETRIESCLAGINAVLAIMLSDEQYNNLLVVTDQKGFERSCSIGLDAIKNKDWAIGKYYFNEKEKVLLEQFYKLKTQFESTKSKIIFDMDHSAEGGRGNAMALKQLGLSEVITSWSKDEDVSYDLVNRKDFENPETDFNKIISASRWYFNTGDGTNFGLVTHGYRFYDFGKVEPDKKYYGKLTPDVTYSRLYTKEPITILDKLYQHTKKTIPNPNELLSAGILNNVKSKDIARLIDTYPAYKDKQNLIVPYRVGSNDEPVLIELIDPPMLSYRIKECLVNLDVIFKGFIERDHNNKYKDFEFIDITDRIYVKEENKKGDIKVKLHPDFKQNTMSFRVPIEHRNAVKKVPLTLSVGYDMPERNAFNGVSDPSVKVWLLSDTRNDNGVRYCTLVETDGWLYIHQSAVSGLRVLSIAELGK